MSRELDAPVLLNSVDPAVFDYVKAGFRTPYVEKFKLRDGQIRQSPITPFIRPLLKEIAQVEQAKPRFTRIEGWQKHTTPGEPFMGSNTRFWHLDNDDEILITNLQGTEFLHGASDDPRLTKDMTESDLAWELNNLSDAQLVEAGFSIQQILPNVAVLSGGGVFHRTPINTSTQEATRYMLTIAYQL